MNIIEGEIVKICGVEEWSRKLNKQLRKFETELEKGDA